VAGTAETRAERADPQALQRRTLRVLIAAQVAGGAGFFLGISVIALLARDLSGSDALSGVPPALGILASALAAAPLSSWMGRVGRRPGLAAAHLCAAGGSLVVLGAAAADSFVLLCLGGAAFGVGNTSNLLARYAAADLSPPERRARAISTVLLVTTLGAVAGPNLASATAALGGPLGVPGLAAPFAVCAAAFALAALILTVALRPDPLLAARALRTDAAPAPDPAAAAPAPRGAWSRSALVALGTLAMVNVAMIGVMTMTPLHLDHAGQSLRVVGVVISLHVAAMFLPSPLTGWLADRLGRTPVIAAAAATLVAAGLLAAVSDGDRAGLVAVALVLLGLAWNLGLISGSALLTDATAPELRPRVQGQADLAMGLLGGGASVTSGLILGLGGFGLLAGIAAALGATLGLLAAGFARLEAART
jgi:MFS family permease